jgi:hypothetical protein
VIRPDYLGSHGGPLSPLAEPAEVAMAVATAADLRAAGHHLGACASSTGRFATAAERIVVAAHEVSSNALQRGWPPGRVRAWRSGDVLHVPVDDGVLATALRRPDTARRPRPATRAWGSGSSGS